MQASKSPFAHIARLYVKPFPTTAAGTRAVLEQLKIHGAVTVLRPKAVAHPDPISQDGQQPEPPTPNLSKGSYFTVGFSSLTPHGETSALAGVSSFTATSNTSIPDPKEEDPYNVRGLLTRKPAPPPQTFACTLRAETSTGTRKVSLAKLLQSKPHSSGYRVEDDDVFAKSLEAGKAPTRLVRGLLKPSGKQLKPRNSVRRNEQGDIIRPLGQYSLARMYWQAVKNAHGTRGLGLRELKLIRGDSDP